MELHTLTYEVTGAIARITLNRPERANAITFELPHELAACVERANLDPAVRVIALAGNGRGFCGGYDLGMAEHGFDEVPPPAAPRGSPLDPAVIAANHVATKVWEPTVDYALFARLVRGFMSLFN